MQHFQRTVRVFISSTFRDMKAERDYLVKFTFPQLRKLCESRGVTWGEVDLRWGVTDEQKAEGKVLPICLEEIKRCRPYFIGLLGERYGWIPETIAPEVIEREPWLAEHIHGRKSVTELEILHGVLNNPDMAEHAFFYFRDPAYVESLPPETKKDFISESAEDAKRLRELKERIRTSDFPVRQNYPEPKALGDLVLADMTAVIDELYPEGSQPEPLDREAMEHEAYARSRERVYIGRPEYFAKLDAHANGGGDQPLVILGESGCGKSALLANWVSRYRQAHPEVFVLQHYIGATPYSADWAAMLRRLMGEFKRHFDIRQEIPYKLDELRSAFANWLNMAAVKGRVVLILDALNQLEDRDGAPDLLWLPLVMPENVRLIVSTLPGRALDEIKNRRWPTMDIKLLTVDERKELIRQFLRDYGRNLSPARVERIAAAPQSANPLYLRVLLDELRLFGQHEQLEQRINHYLQAESAHDLYGKVIGRWEQDYGTGITLVGDTLSLLWAARRGLSETELLEALGTDGQPLPRAVWSPLYLAMSDGLVSRGGLLTFAHGFLRKAVQDSYLPTEKDQEQAHLRLADYFTAQLFSSDRKLEELPWQLFQAKAWNALEVQLTDLPFFAQLWAKNSNDVLHFWAQLEEHSQFTIRESYSKIMQMQLFTELKDHSSNKASICNPSILYAVSGLMKDTGHLEQAYTLRERLLKMARGTENPDSIQACLSNLGLLARMKGDLTRALQLHREEEAICRKLSNPRDLAICLNNLGVVHRMLGNFKQALAAHQEQKQIALQSADILEQAMALLGIGNVRQQMRDFIGAEHALREAEQLQRQSGSDAGLTEIHGSLATILLGQKRIDEAEQMFLRSMEDAKAIGDRYRIGIVLHGLANVHQLRGDLSGGLELLEKESQLCRQLGDKSGLGLSLTEQAGILVKLGRTEEALARCSQAEEILQTMGDRHGLIHVYTHRLSALLKQGKIATARSCGEKLLGLCKDLGLSLAEFDTLVKLAKLEIDAKNHDQALNWLEAAEQLCGQKEHAEDLQECLQMQAALLALMKRSSEALHKCDEAIRICQQADLQEPLAKAKAIREKLLQYTNLESLTSVSKEVESERDKILQQIEKARSAGDEQTVWRLLGNLEAFCRQQQDDRGLQSALYQQGNLLYEQQRFDAALKKYRALESEVQRTNNRHGLATCLSRQGMVARRENRMDDAERLIRQAIELFESLDDEQGLCTTKSNLALIIEAKGDMAGALQLHQECETMANRLGDRESLQSSLGNQAAILADMGQVDRAGELLAEQEEICRQSSDERALAQVIVNEGILKIRGLHQLSEGLVQLSDGCRRCLRHHVRTAFQQAMVVMKGAAGDLARPIIENRVSRPDDKTLTMLEEFIKFGVEFREPDVLVWSVQALAHGRISREEQAQARNMLEKTIEACRRQQWQEPLPRLEEVQGTIRRASLVDATYNQVTAHLERNTIQSLTEAILNLSRLACACQSPCPQETFNRLFKMIEAVFQKLASLGESTSVVNDTLLSTAFERLEESIKSLGSMGALAWYYYLKADYHLRLKKYGRALGLFSKAAELLDNEHNKKHRALVLYRKSLCLGLLGRDEEVAESAREAWDIAVEINDKPMQEELDDLFKHLKSIGISKPEKQSQVSLVVKTQDKIYPDKVYKYVVSHPEGLFANPCVEIMKVLNELPGDIEIEKDGEVIDGKSIMRLMMLAAVQGSSLNIKFSQQQDGRALDPLIREGIIVPEGTDACYTCRKCSKEIHIGADQLQKEQVCPECGERNLLQLEKYNVTFEDM